MKNEANLKKQLAAALKVRATGDAMHMFHNSPCVALAWGLKLNLAQGIIYTSRGVDLVAVRLPEAVKDIEAIAAAVLAIEGFPGVAMTKRAALREGLGALYRERRRGPVKKAETMDAGAITMTAAHWARAKELGRGNASEGVRKALDATLDRPSATPQK